MICDLMPEQITHPEIKRCPCCASHSTNDAALGFDRFECDTEVILPERAVIHLGRTCKRNMQIQATRSKFYGGYDCLSASPLNPISLEART